MNIIAKIKNDFPSKFGLPRQAGLVKSLKSLIIFEPEYRNPDSLRGIEEFSHLWIIWEFSQAKREKWSATVRPPRLGGNERRGVFATRSPFRPNPIGLSCVKLERVICDSALGCMLEVSGADLMDSTPIYDIKPYLPYVDRCEDARGGFSDRVKDYALQVVFPPEISLNLPSDLCKTVCELLSQDPRPSYQEDPERIYGFQFAGYEIKFRVAQNVLTVCGVYPAQEK